MMKKMFKLQGLQCASCAAKIERAVNALDGVDRAWVNFLTARLVIEGSEEKMAAIVEGARGAVKKSEPHVKMVEV